MADFTLESVRNSLIRQEDTIVFNLLERAEYPSSSDLYHGDSSGSLFDRFVKETEAIQSKFGRYLYPDQCPFFPNNSTKSLGPPGVSAQLLHPAAAPINVNEKILDVYINKLLPLITSEGQQENYVCIAACDLQCLQALSRRIHYGKFVAEIKFRDAPEDYTLAIQAQDKDALRKLLTFESVEEMVKKRVEKKARVLGQEVQLEDGDSPGKCKIDPAVLPLLYGEWVMPLTKDVEVEYLLRRLD